MKRKFKSLEEWCLENNRTELINEWNYKNNLPLTPQNVTYGCNNIVGWVDINGCYWDARISSRTIQSQGSPYLAGKKIKIGFNDLLTTHPEHAKDWDYEKNNELYPTMITAGSEHKVNWLCELKHLYKSSPYQKIRSKKCPYCSNRKLLSGFNDLETRFPKLASEWDFKENKGLKPSDVFPFTSLKVFWKCKNNHSWEATINSRHKNGCPKCANALRISLREKIVWFYIKKYFPLSIPNYRFSDSSKHELDIYIPNLKIGIEYDGTFYHQNIKRDQLKDKIAKQNEINVIHIREPKLPNLSVKSKCFKLRNLSDLELLKCIIKGVIRQMRT